MEWPSRKSLINPIPAIRRLANRDLKVLESNKSESSRVPGPEASNSLRRNDLEIPTRDIRQNIRSRLQNLKASLHLDDASWGIHSKATAGPNINPTHRQEGSESLDDLVLGEYTTICQSDIPRMFLESKGDEDMLLGTLVLSAENDVVEAGSCEFLMRKKFGEAGVILLQHVASALKSESHLSGCSSMTVKLNNSHIAVINHVDDEDPSQALPWLCLAVRIPKPGWVSTSEKITESSYGCRKFGLKKLEGLASSAADASCWHPLFESAVVAVEPSVKISPGSLLQVDFHTLVRLAAVEHTVKVDSGVVLLGYSTALIPVKMIDEDTILWHLEVCPHESQLKVHRLQATQTEWLESVDIEVLRSKTARVGWCSKSKVLLGTASLLESPVGWSAGTTQKKSWSWKGVSLQAVATSTAPLQIGLQGGATFERITNTLRFDLRRNYLQLLRSSSREAIIVYDVSAKRGWLVPLLSVLHHMAVTYCQNGIGDEKKGLPIPLAKPEANGGNSSIKALWQSGSVEIETGGDDTLTLRDLLMGFSANLAKISPQKPQRGKIFGYEFMDVVQEVPTAELKRVHINNEGQGWISLLQSLPCLFCSNIGDAIVAEMTEDPNSDCCRLIPGHDYLAASMHSINDISKRQGRARVDGDIRFPGGSSWRPTRVFHGCDHTDGIGNCWMTPKFLQQIRKKQPTTNANVSSQRIHEDGVVVFGESLVELSRLRNWINSAAAAPATSDVMDRLVHVPPAVGSESEFEEGIVNNLDPVQGSGRFVVSFLR